MKLLKILLGKVDIDTLNKELRRGLKEATTELDRAKIIKRLKVVESLIKSPNKAEWFMMDVIPVLATRSSSSSSSRSWKICNFRS